MCVRVLARTRFDMLCRLKKDMKLHRSVCVLGATQKKMGKRRNKYVYEDTLSMPMTIRRRNLFVIAR